MALPPLNDKIFSLHLHTLDSLTQQSVKVLPPSMFENLNLALLNLRIFYPGKHVHNMFLAYLMVYYTWYLPTCVCRYPFQRPMIQATAVSIVNIYT